MRRIFCETLGTELVLPDRLERIVSFSPAVTETLALLGMEDGIVGVSAFCARPESIRAKRKIGSYNTVDRKVLAELDPQIVFTVTGYQREFALKLGKELPVYAIELPVSVAGIVDMIVKMGLITNHVEEAGGLARKLLDTLGRLKPLEKKLSVYLEIDLGGPVAFGAYSYITDALRLLGAENIHGTMPCEWLTPDLGKVRQSDPDVIFYEAKMYKRFSQEDFVKLLEKRGWEEMRAVREGHAFLTPGPLDFVAHHGPSFVTDVMPWLRERFGKAEVKRQD